VSVRDATRRGDPSAGRGPGHLRAALAPETLRAPGPRHAASRAGRISPQADPSSCGAVTYLALLLVLAVMVAAIAFGVFGARGGRAVWPLLAGWGIAFVAAALMSFVGLCEDAAGACTEPARLDSYQAALPALIVLVVAAATTLVPNEAVRRPLFAVLTILGMVLVALRLLDDEQRFVPIVLFVLAVAGIALELGRARLTRAGARTTAG
jgi:hypothetical protein